MVFKDADVGMKMATADHGQAENAVLRCRFLRCAEAGLTTVNFNSMDIWVWYCRFEDCGYGLFNGAGNFHAYENLFLRSKKMDIGTRNLMVFSFVNNTSVGSRCFMDWESGFTWGSPCSIAGNRIIDPTGDFAIRLGNAGPYLVADNLIKSRAGKTTPEVIMTWAEQTFISNTYTIADAVVKKGRYRMVDESVVDASRIRIGIPRLLDTPPRRNRKVFDVVVGANEDTIQRAINEAAQLKGQKPVVHLPMGIYNVDRTLVVPAGCDVQIIGDGGAETATVLKWMGKAGEPLLKLEGLNRATLRDFSIWTNEGIGILAENCDQPGGKVFGCQVNASGQTPHLIGRLLRRIYAVDGTIVACQFRTHRPRPHHRQRRGVSCAGDEQPVLGNALRHQCR